MTKILLCFCISICWHNLSAQTVTLKFKNKPLEIVLKDIQKQINYKFIHTKSQMDEAAPVTIDVDNMPLTEALDLCFSGQKLTYELQNDDQVIVVKDKPRPATPAQKKEILITGQVVNRQQQPLPGATVHLKEKDITGTADANGQYTMVAEAGDQLMFSFVNYKQEVVNIKGRAKIDVVMEAQASALDEVVISTGYQKIEQKNLTGSVTRLKMDSIRQPGLNTVDKMLEGRVPGLIMMQNSGQAGAAPKLRIRGTSTILGTREPLWVVDGIVQTDPVPISASRINDLDFVNLVGNAISGLNPNDIESIDVLKDAAATALYGVRAANGVIVITTKRGTVGPPTMTYNSSVNFTSRPRYTDKDVYMMNSRERVDVSRELIDRQIPIRGVPEAYEKAVIDYYKGDIDYDTFRREVAKAETMNTDWLGAVTQDVLSSNHTLGISGGREASRFYASVGYNDDRGVIKGEYSKRYTGQLKFDINNKNLKAQFGILANKSDRRYTPQELGILNYAYGTSRAIPLYTEQDSLYYFATTGSDGVVAPRPSFNVINEMNRTGQTVAGSGYMATANINYQFMPGLQFESVFAYTTSNTEQRISFDEKTNWVDLQKGIDPTDPSLNPIPFGGELRRQTTRQDAYTVRGHVNFSRFLDQRKKHLLNATAGGELSSTKSSDLAQINRGYFPERGYSFAQIATGIYTGYAGWMSTNAQPVITEGLTNLASTYATATYIYDDRYVLSANSRLDFSNAFGTRSNERFLPIWGLSARWNIDKDLLKNANWVNQAALRLSYGTQGNMLPGQTPYTIIQKGSLNSLYQAFESTISYFPNPNIKWEKTQAYNAGLDFSLFNARLNGTIEYVYKKTTNAFLSTTISGVNGVRSLAYIVNGGVLENQGVELSFNFTPVNAGLGSGKKKLVWRIDPQLGQVFNKLLNQALNKGQQNILVDATAISYGSYLNGLVPVNGKSVNTFYAYRFKGLNQKRTSRSFMEQSPKMRQCSWRSMAI